MLALFPEKPRNCIPDAAGKAGGEVLGGFSPISKPIGLGRSSRQIDGPVPRNRILQEIQELWDPDRFARVDFMGQISGCVQSQEHSAVNTFPYSGCLSPAPALRHPGTSAGDREPQEPERIRGHSDHQGKGAAAGNTRVQTQ